MTVRKISEQYDYIILRAGLAGCVLAIRLSETHRSAYCCSKPERVTVIPFIHMPAGLPKLVQALHMNSG